MKAAKEAANERTFRGLPWQCTVCAKKHFKTVSQMQSSRCAACGAKRDAVVGPRQLWREELKEGDWVYTKRYAGSGLYLGRIEAIEVNSLARVFFSSFSIYFVCRRSFKREKSILGCK